MKKLDVETTLLEIAEALDSLCKKYTENGYGEIGCDAEYWLTNSSIGIEFGWTCWEEHSNQNIKISISDNEIIVIDEDDSFCVFADPDEPRVSVNTYRFKNAEDVVSYLSSEMR